jgi:hypothetical protein
LAEFCYRSPYPAAEVLARLRALSGHPATETPPGHRARGSVIAADSTGRRFRVRIERAGRRQPHGPVAVGEVRAEATGSTLVGAIRASRVDMAGAVLGLGFFFWMGWRTGEPIMGFFSLTFGAVAIGIGHFWSAEDRDDELREVLLAVAGAEDGTTAPSSDVRDG